VEDGKVRVERYWTPSFAEDGSLSEESCIAGLREALTESVRLRLVSDVPLGVLLSGGVDSSIVTGLMGRAGGERVKTFSIGFEEKEYNELAYARTVSRAFNTEHHEFVVRPNAVEVIPKLVGHYDEPFADSSAIPTFYLSQVTRQHVKVALSGEGGDECFLGYPRYQAAKLGARFDRLPGLLKRAAACRCWQRMPASLEQKTLRRRLKRLLQGLALPPVERYLDWICIFPLAEKLRLYSPDFAGSLAGARAGDFVAGEMERWSGLGPAARAGAADMVTYLPCDLLTKIDVASMANSLEVRCPFLDHHVAEFCARIPERLRLRGLSRKYVLKKAFADLLPPAVLRRGKMGFGVPISRWFRGELSDYLRQALLDPRALARGYFRAEVIRESVEGHIAGRFDHGSRLWALLMFELWHQKYLG
jgi:asparagine synthase (glutamine-hydrolysing)